MDRSCYSSGSGGSLVKAHSISAGSHGSALYLLQQMDLYGKITSLEKCQGSLVAAPKTGLNHPIERALLLLTIAMVKKEDALPLIAADEKWFVYRLTERLEELRAPAKYLFETVKKTWRDTAFPDCAEKMCIVMKAAADAPPGCT
jgi:hypothetical protein